MGVRALLVAVALTAVLVGGACSGGDDDPPAATVPSGSASSAEPTSSTTVGVDAVPEEITVEYVQRVMDALDASWGDMYRLYVEEGGPTAETAAWLDALYDEPELSRIDVDLGREAADGFDSTRMPPGDPTTRVVELISASAECIYFEAERLYTAVIAGPPPAEPTVAIALVASTPNDSNPSRWVLSLEEEAPGELPEDPCAG